VIDEFSMKSDELCGRMVEVGHWDEIVNAVPSHVVDLNIQREQ